MALNLINLALYAQTNGPVHFELINELGQVLMTEELGEIQNFAQYSTDGLIMGTYYWRLKDGSRIIRARKIVIMK
jgi:hypothetical protein